MVWLLTLPCPPPSCTTALMAWAGSLAWELRRATWASLRGLGPPGCLSGPTEWHPFPGTRCVPLPEMPVPPLAADARSRGAALLQSMAESGVDLLPGQTGASCGAKASCSGSAAPAVVGSRGAWLPL